MKVRTLSATEVLAGYDAVAKLYPFIPSLSLWRAWEYAAYQGISLQGRTLDLGCGDGQYFRLLWPTLRNVVGVDSDSHIARAAKQSGVYTDVHVASAHQLPFDPASFDACFANCSLEHMDYLDLVLSGLFRCLRPGGLLLCSVVTEKFLEWSVMPKLLALAGHQDAARALQRDAEAFHHLVNPLPVGEWNRRLSNAGFVAEEIVPIVPKLTSGFFLFVDTLWHIKRAGEGELGELIHRFLAGESRFPQAYRHVIAGLLEMESNPNETSGAVFLVTKPS